MSARPDIGERLKQARKRLFKTAKHFADVHRIPQATYNAYEKGDRPRGLIENVPSYAEILGASAEWILTGRGLPFTQTRLAGYVGAGHEVHLIEEDSVELGLVDAPPHVERGILALEVKGDSMIPAYYDGDIIYCERGWSPPFSEADCLYNDCAVKVSDGPLLIKAIMRGAAPGTYSLISFNAPPREDENIDWAAPVRWVRRRSRGRRSLLGALAQ